MASTLRARSTDTIRLDPVAVIEGFVTQLTRAAERAAAAAAAGRPRDALLAAGAMQMLLRAQDGMLREALGAAHSRRVPPEVRAAVRAAASGALRDAAAAVGGLGTRARVATARQAAIGDALRAGMAPRPGGYTAAAGRAAPPGGALVRQAVRISV